MANDTLHSIRAKADRPRRLSGRLAIVAALLLTFTSGCVAGDRTPQAVDREPSTEVTTPTPTPTPTTTPDDEEDADVDILEAIGPCAGPDLSDEIERISQAHYELHSGEGESFDAYTDSLDYALSVQREHFEIADNIREQHGEEEADVYCRAWLAEDDWEKPESTALVEELVERGKGPLYEAAAETYGD